ncbi:BQ2448_2252 [Microbotryum intermedium]|uniref:BQ2448_2252 protein n=1 Tax=Microbotryum intermedium TaxID=269621 RepID=A0A238F5N1_9BASI|nr:BQ2448_2252 [Microbotryum intermedium]
MSNNSNNNNASPTGPPPIRPPDPFGLSATSIKSYSAAVGVKSPAKATNATATGGAPVTSHPLMHDIANCVIVKTPPGMPLDQVLLALDKQFPSLAGAMPCIIKGQRALRFPKSANLDTPAADGLTVGRTLCQVEKLLTPSKGGVIQCTLMGFFSDPEGVRLFDEEIAALGTVLVRRNQYIGKTNTSLVSTTFSLHSKTFKLPPPFITLKRDGVSERIPLRVTGGMRHCVFCRSASPVRKDCTVAPLCKICGQQSHATQRFPVRHAAVSPGLQPSRVAPADAAAAAALTAAAAADALYAHPNFLLSTACEFWILFVAHFCFG